MFSSSQNSANSRDVNCGPLSLTNASGGPNMRKRVRRYVITALEVVEVIHCASSSFEKLSTRTMKALPFWGSPKST